MRTAKPGEVYLVKCGQFYKIGRTKNDSLKRIENLQSGNPYELVLIQKAKVSDAADVETEIHSLMRHTRYRGEWFLPDDDDLKFIIEIMEERHGK